MDTKKKNYSMQFAILSLVLMIGSGFLLCFTVNELFRSSTALVTLSLSLLVVIVFIAGVTCMAKSIKSINVRRSYDELYMGVYIALLLIASGALLLCFNTGMLNPVWKGFLLSWPMLVFVIGVMCIFRSQGIFGIIVSAAGLFFLMDKAIPVYPNDPQIELLISNFWPAIVIVAGIIIFLCFIIRPKKFIFVHQFENGKWKSKEGYDETENKDGVINYKFVFSGSEQVFLDPVFKGGSIETVFGGLELDLRRTTLPEGNTYLSIENTFGGVELTVPDDWNIEFKSKSFAGGVSDSRFKSVDKDYTRKLIILAKSTFGGITIK